MCLIIAELGSGTFATSCHVVFIMHVAVKCYRHEKIAEKHVLMEAQMLEVCAYVSLIHGPHLLVYYIIYGYIVYRTSLWHLLLSYSTVQDIPILLNLRSYVCKTTGIGHVMYTVLGEPLTVHSLLHGKYIITEGDCAFLLLGKSRTTCLCVL